MSVAEERLRHVKLKIVRAEHHFQDLGKEIKSFLESNPYKVSAKREQDTRRLVYFVESVDPVPDNLSLIAGDVIQNLVTALDHMAY